MTDSNQTTDRTGDISAILYGRILERQRDAEAEHSRVFVQGGRIEARADGVAAGLAMACEIVAGVPAGEIRARAIGANVARRADGIAHVDDLRSNLQRHAPTVAVHGEQHRDRMDADDYAAALRLAAADRAY